MIYTTENERNDTLQANIAKSYLFRVGNWKTVDPVSFKNSSFSDERTYR